MEKKLPKNWINVKLNDLGTIQSGGTPKRSNSNYWTGDIPWVKISDLKKWYVEETTELITEEGLNNSSTKIFPKGTILFTIFATIGKVGVLSIDACTNQAIAGITPVNEIEHKFLTYALIELSEVLKNEGKGVAQKNINLTILKDLNIPLPPLKEQQRIVAKLDTLFTHLENLKTRLANIPTLLKHFRQAILTQAVTGKLTEEWRNGKELETVTLLNENNQIEFEIIDFDILPNNWINTALGNYVNCSRGKFTARPRNDPKYFDGSYPFMQIGDLPREGGLTSNFSKTLNEEGVKISKSFPKGTVVIAIVGATIGITGILEKEMFFPDSLIGMNCEKQISNKFLEFYLRLCKDGFREISYAGGGQPNIKLPTIKNLELLIPPIEEQTEIVKRVENLFAKADQIETQYQQLKEKIASLSQAILAKAFKGELVPQLPTDGDAKDLLAEIQQLKKALKPTKKKVVREKKNVK